MKTHTLNLQQVTAVTECIHQCHANLSLHHNKTTNQQTEYEYISTSCANQTHPNTQIFSTISQHQPVVSKINSEDIVKNLQAGYFYLH